MSQVKKDAEKKMQHKSRQIYTKPHLTAYGTVKDLTTAGSGVTTENNPGQGPTIKRP